MSRPLLTSSLSVNEFKEYYWLKKELTSFCKEIGILRSGSKIELSERITLFFKTGEIISKKCFQSVTP